jgi:hypothetical protein
MRKLLYFLLMMALCHSGYAQSGAALNFDGGNDNIGIPTTGFQNSQSYTIECWLNASVAAEGVHVWEGNNALSNPSLEGSPGNLNFWVNNSSAIATGTMNTGQWYHVACVYDGANQTQSLYVNGDWKGSAFVSSTVNFGSVLHVGSRFGSSRFYPGSMDEMRIWTVARTQSEIQTFMSCEINTAMTGLVGNYHFNQGVGEGNNTSPAINTLADASGNGYDGNLNNFALSGAGSNWISAGAFIPGSCCAACTMAPKKPGPVAQTPATKVCPGDSRVYSIADVANACNYTWTAPAGGTIISGQGTTSVTVSFDAGFTASASIKVSASNTCGTSGEKEKMITRGMKPMVPGYITGEISGMCETNGIPYSVVNIPGVTYAWSFDSLGASIVSGQGTNAVGASFTAPFTSGRIYVTGSNGCGTSNARKMPIKAKPAAGTIISGNMTVCAFSSAVYTTPAIPHADSYIWSAPSGATISDGVTTSTANSLTTSSDEVTVHFGFKSGSVKVKGSNSCGTGPAIALPVTINCVWGNSLTFSQDNEQDAINVPSGALTSLQGDFTFTAKVVFEDVDHWNMLFVNNHGTGGAELSYTGTESDFPYHLQFTIDGSSAGITLVAPWAPAANTPYQIVFTKNGNTYSAYIDGSLIGSNTSATPIPDYSSLAMIIGNYYQGYQDYNFRGKMDEVSFWNTGVSASFVSTTLSNFLTGNESGLVLYYKMDQTGAGSGLSVLNSANATGSSMNGTTAGSGTSPYFDLAPFRMSQQTAPATAENILTIYPNPAKGKISLLFKASVSTAYSIKIFDVLGREVSNNPGMAEEGDNQADMNIDALAPGVYQLVLQAENLSAKESFVVQ